MSLSDLPKLWTTCSNISQYSYFQSHFSVLKIGRIFPKKIFYEEYLTRWPTFIKKFFLKFLFLRYTLYFLKIIYSAGKKWGQKCGFFSHSLCYCLPNLILNISEGEGKKFCQFNKMDTIGPGQCKKNKWVCFSKD